MFDNPGFDKSPRARALKFILGEGVGLKSEVICLKSVSR